MNKGDSEIILYIIKSFEKLTDTLHNLCNQVGFLQKKKTLSFLHVSKSIAAVPFYWVQNKKCELCCNSNNKYIVYPTFHLRITCIFMKKGSVNATN